MVLAHQEQDRYLHSQRIKQSPLVYWLDYARLWTEKARIVTSAGSFLTLKINSKEFAVEQGSRKISLKLNISPLLFIGALALVILKLAGVITWAWWIVLLPFWAPLALSIVILAIAALVTGLSGR